MKDGRDVRGLIEPPEWSVYINVMQPGWSSGFSRKPDFFAVPERNKPATMSGMVSRVGTDQTFPRIMKVNPLYWDKNLPKSAIQFIYFRMVNNKPFLKSKTSEYLQKNSISYHLARFEESLDMTMVRSQVPLIGK